MKNIKCEVKDKKLILTVDLSQKGEASASGKTLLIANSGGFQSIDGGLPGMKLQLNVSVPAAKAE